MEVPPDRVRGGLDSRFLGNDDLRLKARRSVSRVLSRFATGMAIHLGRSSPNASRDRPERRRESSPGTILTPCLPLLLGLAPGGVFPAVSIAGDAVRSYRTISPLPPMVSHEVGGVFSVALSLGSPPPAVNRHRAFRGARTFLPPPRGEERPSDRLASDDMGQSLQTVKIDAIPPLSFPPKRESVPE